MDIADTIDWRRVKSFSMLCTVSEIYKVTKHYSEARDILLLAYERYPDRANVVYALCELAIKLDELNEAIEYYREYVHLKPHDTNRYVLLYKIYEAQDVPLEEKISLLEEFKRAEYTEKWAYELALLYHRDGQETKCVETCDELALWFGEGPYVRKALELKMQHSPLTREQQQKYDGVYDAPTIPTGETEETVHIYETQSMPLYAKGASPYETAPMDNGSEPLLKYPQKASDETGPLPAQTGGAHPVSQPVSQPVQQAPGQQNIQQTADIQIAPITNDKYSTMNLQEELARNMEEFYAREKAVVPTPYYGVTSQLYDQSQEQFMQQLNQAGPMQQPMPEQMYGQAQPMPQQPEYQQPAYQQPVYEQPQQMYQQPVYEQPVQPGYQQPVYEQPQQMPVQPAYQQPVYEQPQQPVYEQPPVQVQPQVQPQPPVQPQPQPQVQVQPQPVVSRTEEPVVDEQVPGQIDLTDFMKDWEEKKKNGEEQMRQQLRSKTKEQTADIMSQLAGVIPGLDDKIEEHVHQTEIEKPEPAEEESTVREEVLKDDKKGVVTRTTIPSPIFEREEVKRTESGAKINGPARTSITEAIPDVLPDADMPLVGDVLPSGRKLTLDEEYGGNIAQIRKEDKELVKRLTGELPEPEEVPEPEPQEPQPEDYGETEEMEEVEQPDLPEDIESEREPEPEPQPDPKPEGVVIEKTVEPAPKPEPEVKPEPQETFEEKKEPVSEEAVVKHGLTAPIQYPYSVDDIGEVEELETIDQPDEVDDMLKTRPIPQEEIEARMRYEAGIEEDFSADEENGAKKANHPSWMKLEENITSRRDFDESEMAIFGRFEGIESLKAQIVDVMDDMKMEASRGNVIVMGSEDFGCKSLAIDIVKAIQTVDSSFSGKVAKISGEALNKKNIQMTLQKLANGALIVENAGGLTPITVNAITETLQNDVESILVVLEGEKETLEPLLNGCAETKTVFDARIVIDDFSNADLVAYAKGYAREMAYSIDDMGTLALYNKIGDMQTIDHVVTVDEVIEIVDNAIRHVDRKNMSHFMDVLLAKRYDDDDCIVLREKDFLN